MDVLIDTNVLYYLTGIESSDFSSSKIENFFKSKGTVNVSDITLIELIAHYPTWDKPKIALGFLSTHSTDALITLASGTEVLNDINYLIHNDGANYDPIRQAIISYKKIVEVEKLEFLIVSIVTGIASIMQKNPKMVTNDQRVRFALQCKSLVLGNKKEITKRAAELIDQFYQTDDNAAFKKGFEDLIAIYNYILNINLEASIQNRWFNQSAPDGVSHPDQGFVKRALEKLNGNLPLFEKLRGDAKKQILGFGAEYKAELSTDFNPQIVSYNAELLVKMLSEERRLSKNDLIDSHFMGLYAVYDFYTYDKKFSTVIEKFDSSYGRKYADFLAQTKG